ncbi:hypothetical protein E2C01_013499 [Portunus trituberculatus]|uniref:Uncharacterized protein n=1 Tax=Portunus trituberculatus TaxID=210409 RepID=A0A5B7DGF2_PORTR|nr:hypothetical protein [Portunus trituberculatus]
MLPVEPVKLNNTTNSTDTLRWTGFVSQRYLCLNPTTSLSAVGQMAKVLIPYTALSVVSHGSRHTNEKLSLKTRTCSTVDVVGLVFSQVACPRISVRGWGLISPGRKYWEKA